MPQTEPKPSLRPAGWRRRAARLPIPLFRIGLGPVFGKRLLLLHHTGRATGLDRRVVLEVVAHDAIGGSWTMASGFGPRSDWYRNLCAEPKTVIQFGNQRAAVQAAARGHRDRRPYVYVPPGPDRTQLGWPAAPAVSPGRAAPAAGRGRGSPHHLYPAYGGRRTLRARRRRTNSTRTLRRSLRRRLASGVVGDALPRSSSRRGDIGMESGKVHASQCWMLDATDLLQLRWPDRRRRMTARSRTATRKSAPQTAASTPRTVELGEESLLEEVAHHANPAVARAKTTSAAVDRTVRRTRSLRAVRGSVPARRCRVGLRDCLSSLGSCGGISDIDLTSELLITGPGQVRYPAGLSAAGVLSQLIRKICSTSPWQIPTA